MWVFRRKVTSRIHKVASESWAVGYYDPDGDFLELYEFNNIASAALQTHFLNGGSE